MPKEEKDHPAVNTVGWIWDGPNREVATYRSKRLQVSHFSPSFHMGYINGVYAVSCDGSMQDVCNLLYREVDKRCEEKTTSSNR
jgi:hypothetical protein